MTDPPLTRTELNYTNRAQAVLAGYVVYVGSYKQPRETVNGWLVKAATNDFRFEGILLEQWHCRTATEALETVTHLQDIYGDNCRSYSWD